MAKYIQVKHDSVMYPIYRGWILEVEDETANRIMGARAADRFLMTEQQTRKLRVIAGTSNPFIVCDEATVLTNIDGINIDKHNLIAALSNVAKQHGYFVALGDINKVE